MLDVSEAKSNDHSFFSQLKKEQDSGGTQALMKVLLDYNLEGFNIRDFPDTPARVDQKLLGMSLEEEWWYQILCMENPMVVAKRLGIETASRIQRPDLLKSLNEYGENNRKNFHPFNATKLGMVLKRLVPWTKNHRPNATSPREWEIPPMRECRDWFSERYGIVAQPSND